MKYVLLSVMLFTITSPPLFADDRIEFALSAAPSLLYSSGIAMDGQALLARTPNSFRRYKIGALVAETLHTILVPFLIAAGASQAGGVDLSTTLFGSFIVYRSILRIQRLLRHVKNADQLHLLLAKERLPDNNLRAAVRKQTLIEFAIVVARNLAIMAIMKTQRSYAGKMPAPLLINLLVQMVVAKTIRRMFNDESMIDQMNAVFDNAIDKNEQFIQLFKKASA